ncbi:unnamed protein product [Tilletia caries]|uniref:Uncharacterized protein n=1 Tax=Tilletia caries TaxID=13290 RepID=A0ABN7JAK5_9BASI|nr:unnamed protein product [Tilletia caries]
MLNPTSFIRLLITAAAVLPLIVTALPGVDPVNNRRGGAKLSSYHGNISTSTPILVRDASAGGACNTAADCGSDAPMCEFPWVFEPSPYNQPQRVCMLAINYQGCNSDSQCTTHNCITGADQPICFPDDGGCTANSCPQIPTTDMRCSCVHQHIDLHSDIFYVYLYLYFNNYYHHTEDLHHHHFRVDRFDVQAQLVDHINYLQSFGLKRWHDDDVQEQHQ